MVEDMQRTVTDVELDKRVARARHELVAAVEYEAPSMQHLHSRLRRSRLLAGTVAAASIVVLVAVFVQRPDDGSAERVTTDESVTTSNEGLLEPGEVRAMAASPLSGRSTMASVWTGTELIIWGGDSPQGALGDGAAYAPTTDTWRTLAPSPLSARNAPAAVWTGKTMILWGGHAQGVDNTDGASYNPATDTWEPIADAPIVSAGGPQAVWTGDEMLVLAGFNSTAAAAYDPATDTWRTIDPVPGQPTAPYKQVVWTGEHMVTRAAYGGVGDGIKGGIFAYDVADERWRELPPTGHDDGVLTQLAWTGDQLLRVTQQEGATIAAYDFNTDQWTSLNTWPSDMAMLETSAWTGRQVLLWGGGQEALLLDPATGALTTTPAGGGENRVQPASVWADGILLIWGGFRDVDDGIMLRPVDPPPANPGTTGTIPSTTGDPNEHELIPVAGPDGISGYIDSDGRPTEVNGRLLPVQRVVDDDGNLIGYFGCTFLSREAVESETFDAATICSSVTTTVNG